METVSTDEWRKQLDINVMVRLAVTRSGAPALRKSRAGPCSSSASTQAVDAPLSGALQCQPSSHRRSAAETPLHGAAGLAHPRSSSSSRRRPTPTSLRNRRHMVRDRGGRFVLSSIVSCTATNIAGNEETHPEVARIGRPAREGCPPSSRSAENRPQAPRRYVSGVAQVCSGRLMTNVQPGRPPTGAAAGVRPTPPPP